MSNGLTYRTKMLLGVISFATATAGFGLSAPGTAGAEVEAAPEWDESDRGLYGFPTSEAALAEARSFGSNSWGTPLTPEEETQMSLRSELVELVAGPIEEVKNAQPEWFAGAHLEHENGGRLVVMATDEDAARGWAADLRLLPEHTLDVRPATYSYLALSRTFDDVSSRGSVALRDGRIADIHGAGLDVARNRVVVFVQQALKALPQDDSIEVRVEEPGVDAACSSWTNCTDPRGGAAIRKSGQSTGFTACSLGFTIKKTGTSDLEFWTAGHCGYEGSNTWYTADGSYFGSETYIGDYTGGSKDYMRVELSDSKFFRLVKSRSESVAGWEWPVQGGPVCASLGRTRVMDCGTVQYSATSWTSTNNGRTMYGGRTSGISIQDGDSGSPVYRDAGSTLTAVGLVAQANGNFTRVDDIAGTWFPG